MDKIQTALREINRMIKNSRVNEPDGAEYRAGLQDAATVLIDVSRDDTYIAE